MMRKTKTVKVANLKIGGENPVLIQTMIKIPLKRVAQVLNEISTLKKAGCDFIRLAYRDRGERPYLKAILESSSLPVEVDIHFNSYFALEAIRLGASGVRINPGNIKKKDLKEVIQFAKEKDVVIRIGVNIGSVPERYKRGIDNVNAMVSLAQEYIEFFEKEGFNRILISIKSDSVVETYKANLKIGDIFDYPIHLGVTATGVETPSIVKSSIGIGALLLQGIGNIIRVSLTASSLEEVKLAKIILSSLGIRRFGPEIVSCPGCSRAQIDIIKIARAVGREIDKLGGSKYFKIAIMGCEVNGPGEAREADIGIAGGKNWGALFKKGKIVRNIREKDILKVLIQEIKKMISEEV